MPGDRIREAGLACDRFAYEPIRISYSEAIHMRVACLAISHRQSHPAIRIRSRARSRIEGIPCTHPITGEQVQRHAPPEDPRGTTPSPVRDALSAMIRACGRSGTEVRNDEQARPAAARVAVARHLRVSAVAFRRTQVYNGRSAPLRPRPQ